VKIHLEKEIGYFEVDADYRLKPGVFFQLLQETAIRHTEAVGLGTQTLLETRGAAWLLHQVVAELSRCLLYREKLNIVTWARGLKGFKALREFEVFAGEEKIASVSTAWLYVDVLKKRIRKVPEDLHEIYTIEPGSALGDIIDAWKGDPHFEAEFETAITLRASDFDPNGHVNNALYVDYLETALREFYGDTHALTSLKIQYNKEIDRHVTSVKAGLKQAGEKVLYKIFDRENVYACGEARISVATQSVAGMQ
jgi:acyl-ACP thioesterase